MGFDIKKCKKDKNRHLLALTKDGKPVRILTTDRRGLATGENRGYPLVGLIDEGNKENITSWTKEGRYSHFENENDLMNVPESKKKFTVGINIYKTPQGEYTTQVGTNNILVAHKIDEFKEGEGIEDLMNT